MIWKHLGFKRDIFFVEPLRPVEDDIRLFVGRDEEATRYLVDTLSGDRALKIVTGQIGVGKTTFVNACQYFSYMNRPPHNFKYDLPNVLPCFEKIQIRETDDIDQFFQQVITSLCQSIAFYCKLNQKEIPREVADILSFFLDLVIKTSSGGISIGASILGSGGEFSKTGSGSAINIVRNARYHLKRLVEVARTNFDFHGVFVIVNNLDILPKDKLVKFVNETRDELFDIEGIYWTLIGRVGIGSIIETEADRVADYLSGTELCIEPLNYERTKEIIDVRVQEFRSSPEIECPLSDEIIRQLHFLSLQETRETLKICGEIVKRVMSINPSYRVIPDRMAMGAFITYAHDRAKDLDLTDSKIKILKAVYEKKKCRPKEFADYGYTSVQGFTTALKGLVGKGLLSVEEKGRARIYRMTGITMFAAITGALGDEIQHLALEKLRERSQDDQPKMNEFNEAQLEFELDE